MNRVFVSATFQGGTMRRHVRSFCVALALVAALTAVLAAAATAAPAGRAKLSGSVPKWATPAAFKAAAAPGQSLGFQVYLGWRNGAGARALARAVSDPASPQYGRYLSPAKFRRLFAPREADVAAVRSWLMKVAAHKCYHHKRRMRRVESIADEDKLVDLSDALCFPDLAQQLEKEQILHDVLQEMPPRCRRIVQMLFYEQPPLPYREVAEELNLAEGSIGFIRGRCLQKLRRRLEEMGF